MSITLEINHDSLWSVFSENGMEKSDDEILKIAKALEDSDMKITDEILEMCGIPKGKERFLVDALMYGSSYSKWGDFIGPMYYMKIMSPDGKDITGRFVDLIDHHAETNS